MSLVSPIIFYGEKFLLWWSTTYKKILLKSITLNKCLQLFFSWRTVQTFLYDAVSDVVEFGVHWRSDFQIGTRVLKICLKPIIMHIYGMQYDFMHRSCWNHSNFENSWFYNVISTSDPQNHWGRGIASPSIFLIGMSYIGWYHVKEHVQSFQNMYGKGG